MGKKDISEKNLEQYADVFSDIINALLYTGKHVVKEKKLYPAPTESFYKVCDGSWHQQFQDISMYENRNGQIYVQYAIENQTEEDNQMILRQAGYEGAIYRGQYRNQGNFGVILIVLNWGEHIWNPVMDMHMFLSDKEYSDDIKQYINNHVLRIFNMQSLPPDIRKRFHSDMRIVVDYLAEKENYKPTSQKIKHLEAFLFMMKVLTGDDRFEKILEQINDKKEGEITMCELIDRYWNAGLSEGISQGFAQSIIQVLLCRGAISKKLQNRITGEQDINKLKEWITLAATAQSVQEFETNM